MNVASRWLAAVLFVMAPGDPAADGAQQTVRDAANALLGAGTEQEVDSIATVLALQIASFPVGSSSGGFTLTFENGAVREVQSSFGPFFAERAPTLGVQGAISLGVNVQSTRFASFEGRRLRNGELASTIVIDGRVTELDRFTFDVNTQTTSVVATLAVDDDKDVSVIIPLVRTTLSGTRSNVFMREDTIVDVTGSGLGDMAVRGKWTFLPLQDRRGGLAAAGEVYFPTGDEGRLSTTGRVRIKPMLVASATFNGFSPHANIGYTFGGPGAVVEDRAPFLPLIVRAEPGDEFNYAVGGEASPASSVTLFADLIGRTLKDIVRFDDGRRILDLGGLGPTQVGTLVARTGSLNVRLAAVGARVQVLGTGLISAGLIFPLNDGGVKPGLTPVVGFEYTFGKKIAARSAASAAVTALPYLSSTARRRD